MSSQVERAWALTRRLPFGGRLFAALVAFRAPYFRTIRPRFVDQHIVQVKVVVDHLPAQAIELRQNIRGEVRDDAFEQRDRLLRRVARLLAPRRGDDRVVVQ